MKKSIVFCGGGTAGHVMPNIALIEQLKNKDIDIHYIGGKGIEKEILKNYPFVKYHEIDSPKLIRKLTFKNLTIPFKLIKSINFCKKLLKEINPSLIFSKGGYLSIPVVMASKNIPVLSHESDYTMGLANKLIYKFSKNMFFSFEDTCLRYPEKGIFSGTPIRKNIFNGNKFKAKEKLKIINNKANLLIVGGSTGAKSINDFIYKNHKELCKKYNVIHITGKDKNNYGTNYTTNYYPIDYVHDIENYLSLADIVISRAGSNAIFEFLALKKPMILIPLPKDQSRGDQILNAEYFNKKGFAEVISQENLNLTTLQEKLSFIENNKNFIYKNVNNYNFNNGTKLILDEISNYIK